MNKRLQEMSAIALSALALAMLSPTVRADAPDAGGVRKATKPAARNHSGMKIAPQKPNGSGIVVRYRVDGTPAAGRLVPVELALDRVVGADASVRFQADSGLQLAGGADPRALTAGTLTDMTVDVTPSAEGTAYLHVFTTQGGVTSVASIPVSVGKGASGLRPVGELKTAPDGDKITTMPVK